MQIETYLYGIGVKYNRVKWTKPNGAWSKLSDDSGWFSRIIIYDDTIYGIGSEQAIWSTSVIGGSWTQITTPKNVTDLAYWNGRLYAVGIDNGVYWTEPNNGSWSELAGGGWVSRIVIHDDTIYGIGEDQAIWSTSVHGGSWTKITTPNVIDLAYWNGRLYGIGGNSKEVYWTVPNGSWSKLSGTVIRNVEFSSRGYKIG